MRQVILHSYDDLGGKPMQKSNFGQSYSRIVFLPQTIEMKRKNRDLTGMWFADFLDMASLAVGAMVSAQSRKNAVTSRALRLPITARLTQLHLVV